MAQSSRSSLCRAMSAFEGKADVAHAQFNDRL